MNAGLADATASETYRTAVRAGERMESFIIAFFTWVDGQLDVSWTGKALKNATGLWKLLWADSVLAKWIWSYARVALVPFRGEVTVETALGLVLALACAAPTGLVVLAGIGVFALMLWSRARTVTEEDGRSLWLLPTFWVTALALFVIIFLIGSAVASVDPTVSFPNLLLWLFYFLLFFMCADAASRGQAKNVIWPFLTGAAFSGFVSLYQRFVGWSSPIAWVDKAFEDNLVRFTGTFTNPIFFAEMLAIALPLSMALLLMERNWLNRLVLLGFAGLQGIGLLLSSSRGSWLGFVVSFCVLAVLYDWRVLPVGLAGGAAGLALAPPVLLKRLLSSFSLQDTSNAYRISIWRGALAVIKRNLFNGVGLGAESFRKVYPEYMIIQTPAPHAHSTFLQFLIEAGLFGFLAMSGLLAVWLFATLRAVSRNRGRRGVRWAAGGVLAGCVAVVAGHLFHGIIDYTWYSPKIAGAFWSVVGIGAGASAKEARERP